eukprot:gene16141-22295_t
MPTARQRARSQVENLPDLGKASPCPDEIEQQLQQLHQQQQMDVSGSGRGLQSQSGSSSRMLTLNSAWEENFPSIGRTGELVLLSHAQIGRTNGNSRKSKRAKQLERLRTANPELLERRRVMAQAAFVRHSAQELVKGIHGLGNLRWFSAAEVEVPTAKHLDLILYSREQMVKEYEDMPGSSRACAPEDLPQVPWAIICVKGQDEDYETPMQPITAMRNALGREEGGSGVPIDKAAYEASAEYWQTHATIITGTTPSGE